MHHLESKTATEIDIPILTKLLIEGNKIHKDISQILKNKGIKNLTSDELYKLEYINNKVENIINKYNSIKITTDKSIKITTDKFFNQLISFINKNNDTLNYISEGYSPLPFFYTIIYKAGKKNQKTLENFEKKFKKLSITDKIIEYNDIKLKLKKLINKYQTDNVSKKEIKLCIAKYMITFTYFDQAFNSNPDLSDDIYDELRNKKKKEHIDKINNEVRNQTRNINGYNKHEKDILQKLKETNNEGYKKLIYELEFNSQKDGIHFKLWGKEYIVKREDFRKSLIQIGNSNNHKRIVDFNIPNELISDLFNELYCKVGKEFTITLFLLDKNEFKN